MKTKTVSVRVPYTLYDKLQADCNTKTYTINKALNQYYRSKEPNKKVYSDCNTFVNNEYDQDLISLLKDQVQDLRTDKTIMQQQIQQKDRIIAIQSLGFFQRAIYRLSGNMKIDK